MPAIPHPEEAFRKAYDSLNEEQKQAVDTIEGPVMVVAGPGTGKTQILSVRIGNILLQTDSQPENILCLTYTEAGAIAMRRRLLSFIGPDAYRVQIQTFHAFCNEVIQSNLDYFGGRDLELVSDLEKAILLEGMLQALPPEHPLRRFKGNLSYDAGKLQHLFRLMKEENWTPEFMEAAIQEYIDDLPNREEYQYKRKNKNKGIEVGDVKPEAIEKEVKRMDKLLSGVRMFNDYEQKMQELGRYDFSDMILWVLKAFREETELLRIYQERFLYILVDEYQDTNGAQNALLNLLIDFWDVPNLFVVGDDDQSIYEFQGARVKNILDVYHTYDQVIKVVLLTSNYRSTQPILDASRTLIENNRDRLVRHIEGLDKNLISAGEITGRVRNPIVHECASLAEERAYILHSIKELLDAGCAPKEIAVIYHRHAQSDELVVLFEKSGIPFSLRRQVNALDQPIVRQLINLLQYIDTEHREPGTCDHLLFELFYYPYFRIHRSDIVSLAAFMRGKQTGTWRELINDPDVVKKVKLRDPEALQKLDKKLNEWIGEVSNLTLPILMEKVLNDSDMLAYIVQHPESVLMLESVQALFRFAGKEAQKKPDISIAGLQELIEQMDAHGLQLSVSRQIGTDDAVQFITCHSAKGLEFDHVFLMGCTSNKWEKARGSNYEFSYPDTLTFSNESNETEALRRLFYVAMTRARKDLHISYALSDDDGKGMEPSTLVAEAMAGEGVELDKPAAGNEKQKDLIVLALTAAPEPVATLADKAFLQSRVEHIQISASVLNNYLDCPVKFYFTRILNVPQARNDSMEFGNAIHESLQRYFTVMKDTGSFPSAEELVSYFRHAMHRHKEAFTDKQFRNRLEYGEMILPEYSSYYISTWNKVVLLEYPVRNISLDGIPLNGKLDKLEFNGNEVTVVDYKTGSISYAREKLYPPGEKNPIGGDYWRQMVFYRILLDEQKTKPWKMVRGEFDFIEKNTTSGKFEKKVIEVSEEDVLFVKEQIREVYTRIRNFEFSRGCGKDDCYYCQLLNR